MRGQPVRFVDFRGGVNTKAAPYLVDQTEARNARNVVSTTRGSIRKRDGCQTFSSPSAELLSLYPVDATTTKYMVGMNASDIVKIDSAGTSSSIKGAATVTDGYWSLVQAQAQSLGPVFMSNGVDTPLTWTGAGNVATWTTSAVAAVPNGKHLATYNNRVWTANIKVGGFGPYTATDDPGSTLVWSDIGKTRDWTVSNVLMLDPNDGDQITGLGKVGDYLLVFKRKKTYVIYDGDTGANRRISDTVGCCASRSIAESPYGTYFLTQDRGVYVFDGQTLKLVSDNIAPTLNAIPGTLRDRSAGVFANDHYYLTVAGAATSTALDLTLDYDATIDSWWLHTFAGNQWTVMRYSSATELFAANVGTAKVSTAFVSGVLQDNAANFTSYWKGPWQSFGAPFLRKRLRQIHVDGAGPFDVYTAKDFELGDTLLKSAVCATSNTLFGGSFNFGGDAYYGDLAGTQEDRMFTPGIARSWSIEFFATTSTSMEVDSYTMSYTLRRN